MVAGAFANAHGMTRCSNCPYGGFVLVAFLDSDEVIGIPGLYRELGSPHTAAVRRPSSQIRSLLPQAVSIFPTSWSHSLFLRLCRSTQFMWFLMAGLPCQFHSPASYAPRARISVHQSCLCMPWSVRCESWHIFAASVHIVLVSHEDTTNLDIVLGWDPHHLLPSPR